MMKRKKWTEEEEVTLMDAYSELASSGSISRLRTREKKFQPVADRVNSLHHLLDPSSFPFRWSWRDVSIKIQNMRHQYLGVKQKILLPPSSSSSSSPPQFEWDLAHHHWSNFLRYKQVFGDIDLDASATVGSAKGGGGGGGEGEEEDEEEEDFDEDDDGDEMVAGAGRIGMGKGFESGGGKDGKAGLAVARGVVELGEVVLRKEERRREREWRWEEKERGEKRERRERADVSRWRWLEEEERERRRREESREEGEMEWMERMIGMQMDHEKQVLQMHADACQSQLQVMGILARLMCQFLGPVGGGDGGLPQQVLHNLQNQQQQQQDQGSMGGKSDTSSAGHYM